MSVSEFNLFHDFQTKQAWIIEINWKTVLLKVLTPLELLYLYAAHTIVDVLGFYMTNQHKVGHNCKVKGTWTYILLPPMCFTMSIVCSGWCGVLECSDKLF